MARHRGTTDAAKASGHKGGGSIAAKPKGGHRIPRMSSEMMDTGAGHKPMRGGTIGPNRGKHPTPKGNSTTSLPFHSPGSEGDHKRMRRRAGAPKRKGAKA